MILAFLQRFSALTSAEQKVFLYCVKNCPFPRRYTGDLQAIIYFTGLSRCTVYKALRTISRDKCLQQAVRYIQMDIKDLLRQEYGENFLHERR